MLLKNRNHRWLSSSSSSAAAARRKDGDEQDHDNNDDGRGLIHNKQLFRTWFPSTVLFSSSSSSSTLGRGLLKITVILFAVMFSRMIIKLLSFQSTTPTDHSSPLAADEDDSQHLSLIHIPIEPFIKNRWSDVPLLPVFLRRYEMFKWGHLRHVGDKALIQYGNELRKLLIKGGLGQQILVRKNDSDPGGVLHDEDTEQARRHFFRQRLKAMAPWLRGDPTRPDWPLSQLPSPAVGKEALVISAGANQLGYLKTLIYTVRVLYKSPMAVHIVFRDQADLPNKARSELLEFLGNHASKVSFLDLSTKFDVTRAELDGWDLKPLAIMAVPETKVALMDVDSGLLQAPEKLFQLGGFQRTGALFFHDRSSPEHSYTPRSFVSKLQPHLSPTAQKVLQNDRFITEHVQEAGMVLIDKERRALGVWALNLLEGRPDLRKYVQRDFIYGEKEMYFCAFETISEPYEFARYYPGAIGGILSDFKGTIVTANLDTQASTSTSGMALCGHMVHFDDDGAPLWWNGGYVTRAHDLSARLGTSSRGIQPIWYIAGVDSTTEHGLLGTDQNWRFHESLAAGCLFPNARRKIRRVPREQATTALKAVQKYTEISSD